MLGTKPKTAILALHCLQHVQGLQQQIFSPVLAGHLSLWLEAFQEGCDSDSFPLAVSYFAFGNTQRPFLACFAVEPALCPITSPNLSFWQK